MLPGFQGKRAIRLLPTDHKEERRHEVQAGGDHPGDGKRAQRDDDETQEHHQSAPERGVS